MDRKTVNDAEEDEKKEDKPEDAKESKQREKEIEKKKRLFNVVCKLETICPREDVRNRLMGFVRVRTLIGKEVNQLLSMFALQYLEVTKLRGPMFPITQILVDRAWMHASLKNGEEFDPEKNDARTTKNREKQALKLEQEKEGKLATSVKPRGNKRSQRRQMHRENKEDKQKNKKKQLRLKEAMTTEEKESLKAKLKREEEDQVEGFDMFAIFDYKALRPAAFEEADRENLTVFRNAARDEFLTSAKNNVMMNFKKRTIKWLRYSLENGVESSIDFPSFLSAGEKWKLLNHIYWFGWAHEEQWKIELERVTNLEEDEKDEEFGSLFDSVMGLIQQLRKVKEDCQIPIPSDWNLQISWYRFLPWMHKVLQDFERWHEEHKLELEKLQKAKARITKEQRHKMKGLKLFNVIPQETLKPHFIHLSQTAVMQLASELGEMMKKSFTKKKPWLPWSQIFEMLKFPRGPDGSTFAFAIKTDGVSVSIMMEDAIKPRIKEPVPSKKFEKEASNGLKEYPHVQCDWSTDRVVAIDPGRIDLASCVDKEGNQMHVSNKEYYAMAGIPRRRNIQKKLLTRAKLEDINAKISSAKTASFAKYKAHVHYILQHLHALAGFFDTEQQKMLRLDAYRMKKRALDRICQMITLGDPHTYVAFGAAAFSSSSPGSAPSPGGAIKKRLREHTDHVVDFNEYLTSQMCPACPSKQKMVAPVHHAYCWKPEPTERKEKKKGPKKLGVKQPLNKEQKKAIIAKRLDEARKRWKQPKGTRPVTAAKRLANKSTVTIWEKRDDQDEPGDKEEQQKRECHAKKQSIRMKKAKWENDKKEWKESQKESKEETKEETKDGWYSSEAIRGVRSCQACKRIWNRDTAASLNILYLYWHACSHEQHQRDPRFTPH